MSDIVEQYYRYRKFCKIIGLHSVFNFDSVDESLYNTSYLVKTKVDEIFNAEDNTLPITKDTILFITADSNDSGNKIEISTGLVDEEDNKIRTIRTLSEFDTMLWVNGNIYSLSQKNVKNIFYNAGTDKLNIIYSDDSIQSIDIAIVQMANEFEVKFPLVISKEKDNQDGEEIYYNLVSLFGQEKNDSRRNFVIGMYDDEESIIHENKNNYENRAYTTIIGKGNIASTNRQIILGDFNEVDSNSKFIVCNGRSNIERKNLFTISDGGMVLAFDDFVLSKETNEITHKLSDIHSVTNDDWYKET